MDDENLVVFDCVVFVQGLISEAGPAVRCLELFEQGKISVATSREILAEIQEVLSRSTLRNSYPRLTEERVSQLVDFLLRRGKLFRKVKRRYDYPRDPYDEAYINLALEAKAHFLITRDNDMLDLMKWEREEGREFQKRFRKLRIVNPVEFLAEVETRKS